MMQAILTNITKSYAFDGNLAGVHGSFEFRDPSGHRRILQVHVSLMPEDWQYDTSWGGLAASLANAYAKEMGGPIALAVDRYVPHIAFGFDDDLSIQEGDISIDEIPGGIARVVYHVLRKLGDSGHEVVLTVVQETELYRDAEDQPDCDRIRTEAATELAETLLGTAEVLKGIG